MNVDLPFWRNVTKHKRVYSTLCVNIVYSSDFADMLVQLSRKGTSNIQSTKPDRNREYCQRTIIPAIFLNNFSLCLLMFIPLAGLAIGLFILFSTGMAFRAVFDIQTASGLSGAASAEIQASTAILVLTTIGIVFLLEYISYAIGMTESIWLFRRIIQKKWRSELKYLAVTIGIVALLLIIGAIVETYTLSIGI